MAPNLQGILDLSLIAYGKTAFNTSIDLCSESLGGIGGAVCPLPVYDFIGEASECIAQSILVFLCSRLTNSRSLKIRKIN